MFRSVEQLNLWANQRLALYTFKMFFSFQVVSVSAKAMKYPCTQPPQVGEVAAAAAASEPPRFSDQGKKKGRKAKNGKDKKAKGKGKKGRKGLQDRKGKKNLKGSKGRKERKGTHEKKEAIPPTEAVEQPKKRKPRAAKKDAGRPQQAARNGDGAGGGEELKPVLAEGSQTRVPPPHVSSNHVYSSAYRKAKAKGVTLEECRQSGKDALAYFVQSGMVDDRCGIFREKPKKRKTTEGEDEPEP